MNLSYMSRVGLATILPAWLVLAGCASTTDGVNISTPAGSSHHSGALAKAGKANVSGETTRQFAEALSAVVYKSLQESAASNPGSGEARHLVTAEAWSKQAFKMDYQTRMSKCIEHKITSGGDYTQQDLDRARMLAWMTFGKQPTEQDVAEMEMSLEGYNMEKDRGGVLFSLVLHSCIMQADAGYRQ
ncbi:MAG: hypothetical protein KZQ85_13345 [Candidatus Thiodiazotropha sp. (ex Myrtea sp. 'scaly one' KF741663)]|nr:hypothetical protein [Candidatus Thiodiazotropha sp. (ex Myrtea sp. 'scaly one' KF741663)]